MGNNAGAIPVRYEGDVAGADHDLDLLAPLELLEVAEHAHSRDDALAGHETGKEVSGPDERGDELRTRAVVDVLRRPKLLDPSGVEHAYPIRQRECFLLVVRDEDGRRPGPAQDCVDVPSHLGPQVGGEVGDGLVQQQGRGHGARDGDALLLATRKLARVALTEGFEPDPVQHLRDALAPGAAVESQELHGQRLANTSGLTGVGGVLPSSTARQLYTARFAILRRVSDEALAMWGARTTLGKPISAG